MCSHSGHHCLSFYKGLKERLGWKLEATAMKYVSNSLAIPGPGGDWKPTTFRSVTQQAQVQMEMASPRLSTLLVKQGQTQLSTLFSGNTIYE